MQAEMAINRIPGLSLAIVTAEEPVRLRAFGVKDLDSGAPMRADTPVDLASLSKSFTALAVLQLQEQGTLELDRPVKAYLQDFRTSDPALSGRITVRDLLRHSSGLTRRADRLMPCCGLPGDLDLETAVRRLEEASLSSRPGFRYANSNYVLLAALIEALSGRPFPDYLEQKIIASVGLTRTGFDPAGRSRLHEQQWGVVRPSPSRYTGWYGSSKLRSTAADMAGYLKVLLDGTSRWGKLLSTQELCSSGLPYDRGWQIERRDELCVLHHSGHIWGANSAVLLVPELQLGVVVLINAGGDRAEAIARAVQAILRGRQPAPPAATAWWKVPDNWSIGLAAGSLGLGCFLLVYGGRLIGQLRRRRRVLARPGGLPLARALLLAGMSACLFYLALSQSNPPRAGLPSTLQQAYPVFACTLGLLFLVLAAGSLSRPRRDTGTCKIAAPAGPFDSRARPEG